MGGVVPRIVRIFSDHRGHQVERLLNLATVEQRLSFYIDHGTAVGGKRLSAIGDGQGLIRPPDQQQGTAVPDQGISRIRAKTSRFFKARQPRFYLPIPMKLDKGQGAMGQIKAGGRETDLLLQ